MKYTTCCKNPHLLVAPSLVEVEVVELEICVYSLLCEVELGGLDPSSVEVIVFVVGYGPYPSSVEVDCGCIASVAL